MVNPLGRDALAARLRQINARPVFWLSIIAVLLTTQISPWWYPTPDACAYLSIARSIYDGGPVSNLGSPHLWYPPGYPLMLSPLFAFGSRPILAVSIFHWILSVLCLVGSYLWARRIAPEGAVLLAALGVVNLLVWCHIHRTLTELPFMCLLIWTALAFDGLARATAPRAILWRGLLCAAMLAYLSIIRQAGIMLGVGFGVMLGYETWRQRGSWLRGLGLPIAVGLPAVLALLAVIQYENQMAAQYAARTYFDNFQAEDTTLAWRLSEGLRMRISDVGRVILPGMAKSYGSDGAWLNINMMIYLGLFGLLAVGWVRLVRRTRDVLVVSFLFYFLLYVAYAMEAGARFMVPVVPLLMLCLWASLERLRVHRLNLFGWLLMLHFVAATSYWLSVDAPRAFALHGHWSSIERLAAAVDDRERSIQAVDMPLELRLMLELELDRTVLDRTSDDPIEQDVAWVVQPNRGDRHAEFEPHSELADFTVWRRMETARPQSIQRQAMRHMGRGDARR